MTDKYVVVNDEISSAPKLESSSGGEKDKLGISDAIKWTRNSDKKWVPTAVSLYSINKSDIQLRVKYEVANIIAQGDKTQVITSVSSKIPDHMATYMKKELIQKSGPVITGFVAAADKAWNSAWSRMALPPAWLKQPNAEIMAMVGGNMAFAFKEIENLKSQIKATPGLDASVIELYDRQVQKYSAQRQKIVARAGEAAALTNDFCLYLFYHSIPDNIRLLDPVSGACPNIMNRSGRSDIETPIIMGIQESINKFLSFIPEAESLAM